MKKLFITIIAMLLPLMASAEKKRTYDAKVGKIYYKFNDTERTAMVTYMLYDSRTNGGAYSGDVVIPSSVRYNNVTYSVTAIDEWAFLCCAGVTSVSIPSSIASIDSDAFEECFGLQAVYISDLEAWCNISLSGGETNPLYYAHHLFLDGKEIKDLIIPDNIKTIGQDAFKNCTGLTSVTIPNSVTTIGNGAFYGCSGLTSVELHSHTIGSWFKNNTSIRTIHIGREVTSIEENAFSGCSGLSAVHITDLEAWCNISFSKNSNPLTIAKHLFLNGKEIKDLIVPNGVKTIRRYAFDAWTGLSSVTIPSSVTEIAGYAFCDCSSLTSVKIPNSVNNIGAYAFAYCYDLNSLSIPNGMMSIKVGAFKDCRSLTSITIPNSVMDIGNIVFRGCSGLTSIVVESGNTKYDSRDNCNAIIETQSNTLISGCKNTVIPNSVTSIGYGAFAGCSGLSSMIIPNRVSSIGSSAFFDCNSLKYICLTSDIFPTFGSIDNRSCQYIMPQVAFDRGIPQEFTNYATYGVTPMYIKVNSTTATSATLELTPINITTGKTNGTTTYEAKVYNLEPGAVVKGLWEIKDKDRGVVCNPTVNTQNLVMTVQPAQALSTTKAKLSAVVNEPNDDKHYGFEWLRYDAPDNMTPNRVSAPLYDGQIIGTLSGLNPDKYYKYRPFYKADDGTMFQGEWEAFLTGDANVFFEPEVHTNEPVALTKDGAQLSGVWVEGTEDIQEKGFEYWLKNSGARPTRGGNVTAVIVKGNNTSVTLEGLEAGTEYVYRSYLRTASGTVYGEEKTFKTPLPGDANDDGKVNAADIVEVVNAKAGKPSASFSMINADVDGNGSITESEIAKIIMKK